MAFFCYLLTFEQDEKDNPFLPSDTQDGGGEVGATPLPLHNVFLKIFQDDFSSTSDLFSSCMYIP